MWNIYLNGLPRWLSGKESAYNVGDTGSIPGSGRSPGGRNGNPLYYSCLEDPMDRRGCRLQPIGSQRVGHNLAQKHTYAHVYLNIDWECRIP